MFSCQNVTSYLDFSHQVCRLQNRIYLTNIKGCGLENETINSQSIDLGLEESENW